MLESSLYYLSDKKITLYIKTMHINMIKKLDFVF